MSTPVIVALITGGFGIIVALIQSFRRENKQDHDVVAESLRGLHRKVHQVGQKVDRHITWHAEGGNGGRFSRRDQE